MGVVLPGVDRQDVDDSLSELALLADTAGADVIGSIVQSVQRINVATYVGTGKVEEIRQAVEEMDIDLVIFDDDLSNVQVRNVEREISCKLLDRSALILDIFARNARTATAKTQVELAQLEYLLPRLTRHWTHLSRQKGGIGMRGPGETQIETDRRLIGMRISSLKDRLEKIDKQRTTQRKGRTKFTRISLVGYTNAGKSTLMNEMAGAGVLAENRLFATLDSTTRTVDIAPGREVLLSDTVGFIRKLPHRLIESFKSTLDEVRESDILLHVLDASHRAWREHMQVVRETLEELGVRDKPVLLVFNKIDAIDEPETLLALRREYPDAAFVSGLRGIGLSELQAQILELIDAGFESERALIPVTDQKAIAHIHRVAEVLEETYTWGKVPYEYETQGVVLLRYRVAPRYAADLQALVQRYRDLRLLEDEPQG
ncbi:MAG: GTPase HflX [Bacteroidetes bacterium]|nr:GTPase HflX [Bacteroidota bacterium]MDA0874309.1 GTPase HflX [Bacteroidota bacterium]